jgi:SAM-dependent methyltransferase
VKRVLDVGCGRGGVLLALRKRLNVEPIGVDLRPPGAARTPFPILRANAATDPLPAADVAICTWLAHHLSPDELVAVIRNVGRACRRFIILDLVRSMVPLLLFNFVAPFLTRVNASDGRLSIRRAYQPDELAAIVGRALAGTGATFNHSITPLRSRQIVDISYRVS